MEFKKELLEYDIGVLCDTYEKAKELLMWADENGRRWVDGGFFTSSTEYHRHRENTVYFISSGTLSSKKICDDRGEKVISYDDAMVS